MRFHKPLLLTGTLIIITFVSLTLLEKSSSRSLSYSEVESAEDVSMDEQQMSIFESAYDRKARELKDWQRPDVPFTVALQAGHWKASEAPDEFPNLKQNTGTSGGGKYEWEVNLEIAEKTKALLEAQGVEVEIHPATIPPEYWADLFIAIHADGNADTSVTGYKAAAPRRDLSGRAAEFVTLLEAEYEAATGLVYDPNVTRNMRGYYAFNWRRYVHSLHPKTVAVILETGFLTNPLDRKIIVKDQKKAAEGIASAVVKWKKQMGW